MIVNRICLTKYLHLLFWILTTLLRLTDSSKATDKGNTELVLDYVRHENSSIAQHPYLVSISYKNIFYCSGVVLTKHWVLTTASCIWGHSIFPKDMLRIRTKSGYTTSGGRTYNVTKYILHPKYMFYTTEYNVALMKTNKPMYFNKKLNPITLARRSLKPEDTAVLSGWSIHKTRKSPSKTIAAVEVRVQYAEPCGIGYRESAKLLFCDRPQEEGPCWDDEANPVVSDGQLYGLTSFGISCTGNKYPVRFAPVFKLKHWITSTMFRYTKPPSA